MVSATAYAYEVRVDTPKGVISVQWTCREIGLDHHSHKDPEGKAYIKLVNEFFKDNNIDDNDGQRYLNFDHLYKHCLPVTPTNVMMDRKTFTLTYGDECDIPTRYPIDGIPNGGLSMAERYPQRAKLLDACGLELTRVTLLNYNAACEHAIRPSCSMLADDTINSVRSTADISPFWLEGDSSADPHGYNKHWHHNAVGTALNVNLPELPPLKNQTYTPSIQQNKDELLNNPADVAVIIGMVLFAMTVLMGWFYILYATNKQFEHSAAAWRAEREKEKAEDERKQKEKQTKKDEANRKTYKQQQQRQGEQKQTRREQKPPPPPPPPKATVPDCPYTVLGIALGASKAIIKQAYLEKIKLNHPDRVSHMSTEIQEIANKQTMRINKAYRDLSGH